MKEGPVDFVREENYVVLARYGCDFAEGISGYDGAGGVVWIVDYDHLGSLLEVER